MKKVVCVRAWARIIININNYFFSCTHYSYVSDILMDIYFGMTGLALVVITIGYLILKFTTKLEPNNQLHAATAY